MRFRADFHIHTDYLPNRGWHGEKPKNIAEALYKSQLDVAAVLEHNKITERYNDVREEFAYIQDIEKIQHNNVREVMILLGCEISCIFDGFLYHIGHIFERPYKRSALPEPPRKNCSLEEIEEYKKEHPGISIVFHPAWRDHIRHSHGATTSLLHSGVIDGVEILNGSIFDNMKKHSNGKRDTNVQAWFRNFEFALNGYKGAKEVLYQRGLKLASFGCSDAHLAKMIGTMYTEYMAQRKEDVFAEVRKGATIAVCASNGEVRKRVESLLGRNGAGQILKVLRKPL